MKGEARARRGPPVFAPASRGFGTLLLESIFEKAKFDYAREGFICEINAPLGESELA
jgi:two-component sensor histidine kinase